MARPKPDSGKIRAEIIKSAETMLTQSSGRRLVLSDIANDLGMSQSNLHRFFATKHDLIETLAQNWFDEVEKRTSQILQSDLTWDQKLRSFILTILRVKRDKFDDDPSLFIAYLDLAKNHEKIVQRHSTKLTSQLEIILAEFLPESELINTVQLVEDSTAMFRIPHMIALFRSKVSDNRANQVIDLILKNLRNNDAELGESSSTTRSENS